MTRQQLTQKMKRYGLSLTELVQTISGFISNDFALICAFSCHQQVAFDEGTDEFSAYFNGLTNPKVLITTSDRPRGVSGCCSAKICVCGVVCFFNLCSSGVGQGLTFLANQSLKDEEERTRHGLCRITSPV